MKLNIVPARTGIQWVKLGIRIFLKQPLALTGLIFMYWAAGFLLLLVPFVGPVLALAIVPAATLGMMAATQEAEKGKFPMPTVLLSAFRAGRQRLRAMVVLGMLYATAFMVVVALVPLIVDVPQLQGAATPETMTPEIATQFLKAMAVAGILYLPVSLMFWHAPALVHWHGIAPVKSLFFSTVACVRNGSALMTFGLGWAGVVLAAMMAVAVLSMVTGQMAAAIVFQPLLLLISAMFTTSLYFTFRDSFVAPTDPEPPTPGEPT